MRVLITGTSGFIGRHLTAALPQHTVIPIGLDRDLTDPEVMEEVVCTSDPDVIIHLAAVVGVKRWVQDGPKLFGINFKIDHNLATVLKEVYGDDRPRVLYASSSEVYQPKMGVAVDEDDPVGAPPTEITNRSFYSLEKVIGEYLLNDINLRLFNIVGPGQSKSFALPQMVSRALLGEEIKASNDFRSFCSIDDLARWVAAMLDHLDDVEPGAYNIGNPNNCFSMLTVAMLVKDISGSASPITQYHDGYNIYRKPNITKAAKFYRPKESLTSIIQNLVANPYFKENV